MSVLWLQYISGFRYGILKLHLKIDPFIIGLTEQNWFSFYNTF